MFTKIVKRVQNCAYCVLPQQNGVSLALCFNIVKPVPYLCPVNPYKK